MAYCHISYTFRNLTFTWDSTVNNTWHAVTYTFRNLKISLVNGTWHRLQDLRDLQVLRIYTRFPWIATHGMPLHFLFCLEICHLHKILLVKGTVTFPIQFRNLTSTWNFLCQNAVTFPIIFKILTLTLDSQLFSYVKRCIICKKPDW